MYALVNGELRRYPDLAAFYGREVIERAQRLLAGIIAYGIRTGEFRDVDPMAVARMGGSLLSGQAIALCRRELFRTGPSTSPDELFEEIVAFYLRALKPGSPATNLPT